MSCYSEGLDRCNCGRCIGDAMDRMAPPPYYIGPMTGEPDGCVNECADLGRPGWADPDCLTGMCAQCCEEKHEDDAHGLSREDFMPDSRLDGRDR